MICSCSHFIRRISNRRKTGDITLEPSFPDFIPNFFLCCVGLTQDPVIESETLTDDREGHLKYRIGTILDKRYKILISLGKGTFADVVKAEDLQTNQLVAVKIIRSTFPYKNSAYGEINVLRELAKYDPDGQHLCARMLDTFHFIGHICVVFELLGPSIYDILTGISFQSFSVEQIRHIAYQLCYSVKFLHDLRLTHTDLKPENVVLQEYDCGTKGNRKKIKDIKQMKDMHIKVIDFGSAIFDNEYHSKIVSTRHYRAPEVVLELGWSHPCDVWSIGCTLFELYHGKPLFQTHDNFEHLAMMQRILGPLPQHMKQKSRKYYCNGHLKWNKHGSEARYLLKPCKPLKSYMYSTSKEHEQFFDLMTQMLQFDPAKRISLVQALTHPFFDALPQELRIHLSCETCRSEVETSVSHL